MLIGINSVVACIFMFIPVGNECNYVPWSQEWYDYGCKQRLDSTPPVMIVMASIFFYLWSFDDISGPPPKNKLARKVYNFLKI